MSTRARHDGDGWRVTGQKVWTSGAHVSDIGLLLARTADGPRYRDLTMFLLDMHAPGVEVRQLRQMTGTAAFNEVFLSGAFVPDDHRLGDEGLGWSVAMTTLSNERGALGASTFGGMGILGTERLKALLRYVGRHDDPVVRHALARLYAELRVAQWTRARGRATATSAVPGPSPLTGKLAFSRNLAALGDLVSLVLGPRLLADTGEWGTFSWSELVLGAPGHRLGGGTDEILRNVVGERVLGLPREDDAARGR